MLFDEPEERPQRVCVTAGAGGIGLAVTERFVAAGAQVHLCDISARAVAQTLAAHPGVHATVADVAQPEQVALFVGEALEWMEGIDVLVNGASQPGPRGPIEEIEVEDWRRTLEVNLSGMFYCAQQVAPTMKAQRSGCIVNVADSAARTGLPRRSAYVASKAGVLGLTHNLARELGPDNIRCNAVLPGVIDNDQSRRLVAARARERRQSYEEAEAELLGRVSMRTWIDAKEVADMIYFLASPEAKHVSGQVVGVCGNLEWEQ